VSSSDLADSDVTVDATSCLVAFATSNGESVELETVSDGNSYGEITTSDTLYFASESDSTLPSQYLGGDGTDLLSVYRISGFLHEIEFKSNLGDLEVMEKDQSSLEGEDSGVTVFDTEILAGSFPNSLTVSGLLTGVPYYVRAYPSNSLGYYAESGFGVAIPSGVPSPPSEVEVDISVHVDEVQSIRISATHIDEVQVVTTTADHVTEVQLVQTTASNGEYIDGDFVLRFPEVQTVTVAASGQIMNGSYALNYTKHTGNGNGELYADERQTICLSWDATAAEVEEALENLGTIDDVAVSRSGDASDNYDFGYVYSVSFVGLEDSGNVMQLHAVFNDSCSATQPWTVVGGADYSVKAETADGWNAVGSNTAIFELVVSADVELTEGTGAYRLDVTTVQGGFQTTKCIDWNADADDMEEAFADLANVDSVIVSREGSASEADEYGYTYSVFFDGNAMHISDNETDTSVNFTVALNLTGCSAFSTTIDNVVTGLSSLNSTTYGYEVAITEINKAGTSFDVNADADSIGEVLGLLPPVEESVVIVEAAADDQNGKSWTFSFVNNDGDVPSMVCNKEASFTVGDCEVTTLVQGNMVGGIFYLDDSEPMSSDITADEMATVLEALPAIGEVEVVRTENDGRGGYAWTITFTSAIGDLDLLATKSRLTGKGATIEVKEVQQGNEVGGTFTLSLGGYTSEDIAFDAPADEDASGGDGTSLQEVLEALDSVGSILVSRSEADTEGGYVWSVTFRDVTNPGDVDLLAVSASGLTGVGAAGLVKEEVKGAEAVGNAAALSFAAPAHCAHAQVGVAECGAPVSHYRVDWDTSPNFDSNSMTSVYLSSADLLYTTQTIHLVADETVVGTFQLTYNGETTDIISAQASATEVRIALESLDSVETVSVDRSYSKVKLDFDVEVAYGDYSFACSNASTCAFDGTFSACQLISLDGEWYTVKDSYDGETDSVPLALEDDCSVAQTYQGSSSEDLSVYRWGFGYAWTVTFLKASVAGSLGSPHHNLYPSSASIYAVGDSCEECYYLPSESAWSGLTLGSEYFVRIFAYNAFGTHSEDNVEVVSVVPNQVPFPPEDVSVQAVSGTTLQVSFCNPSVSADDIDRFEVQWDTSSNFSSAESSSASCSSGEYGACIVSGASLEGDCPYQYDIEDLVDGTTYYVRVAARNDVPVQAVNPTGTPPDNTQWSSTISAEPADQVPDEPESLWLYVVNGTVVQLQLEIPEHDGGQNITEYLFEIATDDAFIDAEEYEVAVGDLPHLYENGPLVYYIDGLTYGQEYFVRASATTSIGTSSAKEASNNPVSPMQHPGSPQNIEAKTADAMQNAAVDYVTVSWEAPDSNGGSEVSGYRVEYWEKDSEQKEVQAISLSWDGGDTPSQTWNVIFGGVVSNPLSSTVSASDLRDTLMNMYSTNFSFPIGHVEVERSTVNGDEGYIYTITFSDTETNVGNLPLIQVEDSFTGTGVATSYEMQPGKRPGGTSEVQVVSMTGSGDGTRGSDNPDDSVISGWWRMLFASSSYSVYLSSEASEVEVEAALESLPSVGDVDVTRIDNDDSGYDWLITFNTPVGDRAVLVVDDRYLWTTNDDAEIQVYDGDNAVNATNGLLSCSDCQIGEEAVGYNYVDVDASTLELTVDGLTTGVEYQFAVSAINKYGTGLRASSVYATPPLFEPLAPMNVSVYVKDWQNYDGDDLGDDERLIVYYNAPESTSGSEIVQYLVELDTSSSFDDPIAETFDCPTAPDYAVHTVQTSCTGYNCNITGGYFSLTLRRSSYDLTTDFIPYDAVAMASEETPAASGQENSTVFCKESDYCSEWRIKESGSMQSKMNALDTLTEGVEVSRRDLGKGKYIWSITFLDTDDADDFELSVAHSNLTSNSSSIVVEQIQSGDAHDACTGEMVVPSDGGLVKGQLYYARVFALNTIGYSEAAEATEPAKPAVTPGKPTSVVLTVTGSTSLKVTFSPPSDSGGDTVDEYLIEWATDSDFSDADTTSVTLLAGGAPFSKTITGLTSGQVYYVRVYAHNDQGYGDPQASSPSYAHPYEAPGNPLDVQLGVTTDTMLTVQWDEPSDDGGDDIQGYSIEWDTASTFDSASSFPDKGSAITNAKSRAYTMQYLTEGTKYYVRVSAYNAAGNGDTTTSWPTYKKPSLQAPGQPVGLTAVTGSDSGEIDVSWDYPLIPNHGYPCYGNITSPLECPETYGESDPATNGGTEITEYRLQWSVSEYFSATETDSGYTDVYSLSYTIGDLTEGTRYYVRVAARNAVGYSDFCEYIGNTCLGGVAANATAKN